MELDNWFETQFWPTYPSDLTGKKKGPKSVCRKNVLKLNPNEELQNIIMNRLREWIRHCRSEKALTGKTDRWPFASTWISQERFNDFSEIESSTDMRERAAQNFCSCGRMKGWKDLCWTCYEEKHKPDFSLQREQLRKIGLTKNAGESIEQYNHRCKTYCLQGRGCGSLVGGGA